MSTKRSSSRALGLPIVAAVLAAVTFTAVQGAVPIGNSTVQIGGFFSQGYIESSGNNYPLEAKGGTFDFREMAVNVSGTVGAHLRLGAQGFAQRLGNYGEDKVLLDWAVADYNFRQEFGLRAGRIKLPKGLYGEALDLDAVRPFVFLPMSIYDPLLRDFTASFNGGMAYGAIDARRAGSFDYKVFVGGINMNTEQSAADYFNSTGLFAGGLTDLGMDRVEGGQLMWNTPVSGLKVGYSYTKLVGLYASGPFAFLPTTQVGLKGATAYHTGSVEYTHGDWTLAGEFQKFPASLDMTSAFGTTNISARIYNWYVSAARRFAQRFEAGVAYSSQENRQPLAGSTGAANYLRDWSAGLRFDLNEHVLFKVEHHWVDGRMNLFNSPKTPNPSPKDSSSFFALKTTLSF